MKHRILEEVTGRVGEIVYGKINNYPSLYFYYIFKNLASKYFLYLNYQVQQNKKGHLVFLIEQNIAPKKVGYLKNEIFTYFKNDMSFKIKLNQKVNSDKQKQKYFVSNIK